MATFEDHVAVITGASSGVGRAIALDLAARGAELSLAGRKLETLEAVAHIARINARRVLCYQVDLSRDEDIQRLKENLQKDFGGVDILIHSAGVISMGRIEIAPVKDLDWQYRVNVRAPYALTQALLPMLRSRRGQVVFINSNVGLKARADVAQYAATKHALKALADALREEVNSDGVRVLSVYLGRTATPMQSTVHAKEGKAYHPDHLLQPEDVAMAISGALSLERSAEVTDINIRQSRKPEHT